MVDYCKCGCYTGLLPHAARSWFIFWVKNSNKTHSSTNDN